ncbi:MAG: hypothetical protein WBF03_11600, partial [Xanthobacteraceae bacterium]
IRGSPIFRAHAATVKCVGSGSPKLFDPPRATSTFQAAELLARKIAPVWCSRRMNNNRVAPEAKIGYNVVAAEQPFRHAKVARNGQEKAETR